MFGQLPNLLGRNFAIGYFLPVALFTGCIVMTLNSFGFTNISQMFNQELLTGATLFILVVWLCSIFLLLLNYEIIRFAEGYGSLNPVQLIAWIERYRLRRLDTAIAQVRDQRKALQERGDPPSPTLEKKWCKLSHLRALRFPDREDLLLPTAFGNVICAFEAYPAVLYGLDAIPVWTRLVGVISKQMIEAIEDAKSIMDAWLNLSFLATVFIPIFLIIGYVSGGIGQIGILVPIFALGIAMFSYYCTIRAAIRWGDWVKSTFDIYQNKLAKALGYTLPANAEHRRIFWMQISQAMIYRNAKSIDNAIETVDKGQRSYMLRDSNNDMNINVKDLDFGEKIEAKCPHCREQFSLEISLTQ